MKRLVTVLTGILISLIGSSQSCLPTGINFTTQAQIDNFQLNYPDCTGIEGGVEIEGDDIINLDGLSVLTSIGVSLYITNNDNLSDISGLASLSSVGGSLLISSNSSLTSLDGLENLNAVLSDVFISNNPVLTDISAIGNINAENVAELWITSNVLLETCENPFICNYLSNPSGTVNIKTNAPGCSNPPEVADDCGITLGCLPNGDYNFFSQADIDNFQLNYPGCNELAGVVKISGSDIINLLGLNVVDSINGSLEIHNNSQLTSLAGLDAITLVNGSVTITGNSLLTDISALSNMDTSLVSFLGIVNNPLLSDCEIHSVCDYLSGPFGYENCNISNNNDGCKSRDEVLQECTVSINEVMNEEDHFLISPNPASQQITIETTGADNQFQISIFNYHGQEVLKSNAMSSPGTIDIHTLPTGVYFVRLTGEKLVKVFKFVKI